MIKHVIRRSDVIEHLFYLFTFLAVCGVRLDFFLGVIHI